MGLFNFKIQVAGESFLGVKRHERNMYKFP